MVETLNETDPDVEAALRQRIADLERQFAGSEADREARLRVIERQGAELGKFQDELRVWFEELRAVSTTAFQASVENAELKQRVADLEAQFAAAEADREARMAVIERIGEENGQLRQSLHQALKEGGSFVEQLESLERERVRLADLSAHLEEANQALAAELDRLSGTRPSGPTEG